MKLIKKFADHLCRIYTISAMLFLLLNIAIDGSLEGTAITTKSYLLVFAFAVGFALANLIYTANISSFGVRLGCHFVIVTASAYLLLYLPSNAGVTASSKLLMLLFFAVLYWICMAIFLAFARVKKQAEPKKSEYKSVFKK
ncbi:MAG: hypothetical protein IJW09_01410 [Clostridia bacterium]|nr:hypothetical protein [Clostridia bacterium]